MEMTGQARGDPPPRPVVTSVHNPRIKEVAALNQRRYRDTTGLTLVEGHDELALALASGATPRELLYCPELIGGGDSALLRRARLAGAELVEVGERVFERLAYREHPDGWLATVALPRRGLDDLLLGPTPLVLVTEGVEKPGNLGAMLRTADAAGADAVVASDLRTDWGNPNVVRASKGALFTVQVAQAGGDALLAWLRGRQIKVAVATPDADVPYTALDLRAPVAIVVGAEREGVSRRWVEQADATVAIPMRGQVNSLNVSIAAALLLYEAIRQRGQS